MAVDGKIKLRFVIGGGPDLSFTYSIVTGPNTGRRVELYPTRLFFRTPQERMRRLAQLTPGGVEDWLRHAAPEARPSYTGPAGLTPETVEVIHAALAYLGQGYHADGTVDEAFQAEAARQLDEWHKAGRPRDAKPAVFRTPIWLMEE